MDLVELSRLLQNLIRIGTIHSVDHPARRVRVAVGGLVTGWLRWMELRAGETTTWNPPTLGEQCVILSPSGVVENGIVLYGAPSDVIDTPSHSPDEHVVRFPDGTVITYDHASHQHRASYPDGAVIGYDAAASHLSATGIVTARIEADGSITLDTPLVHCTGKLTVDDLLSYGNGLAGTGGSNGSTITGPITQTGGDLSSNGIVLHTHLHGSVQAGGDTSGGPQ